MQSDYAKSRFRQTVVLLLHPRQAVQHSIWQRKRESAPFPALSHPLALHIVMLTLTLVSLGARCWALVLLKPRFPASSGEDFVRGLRNRPLHRNLLFLCLLFLLFFRQHNSLSAELAAALLLCLQNRPRLRQLLGNSHFAAISLIFLRCHFLNRTPSNLS